MSNKVNKGEVTIHLNGSKFAKVTIKMIDNEMDEDCMRDCLDRLAMEFFNTLKSKTNGEKQEEEVSGVADEQLSAPQ